MKYKNAPITEAIIDLRVSFDTPPNVEGLKTFADAQRGAFGSPQLMESFQVEIGDSEELVASSARGRVGYRLVSPGNDRVLQVRVDGFTYSHLPPYTDWDTFYAEARVLWQGYVAHMQPTLVHRIAVRYINQIQIPTGVDVRNYVNVFPDFPDAVGTRIDGYFLQITTQHPDVAEDCAVILNTGLVNGQSPNTMGLLLDFDAFVPAAFKPDDVAIHDVLQRLRDEKNRMFEASIGDPVREMIK